VAQSALEDDDGGSGVALAPVTAPVAVAMMGGPSPSSNLTREAIVWMAKTLGKASIYRGNTCAHGSWTLEPILYLIHSLNQRLRLDFG
jgi:hypothetical protein